MLKSISPGTNKTYVGYTNNLENRFNKHNSNKGAKSTKGYQWKVIYKKSFNSKNTALSYEYELKNKRKIRKKIFEKYNNK